MSIAVIILNWNGKHLLEKFLPSVIRFSPQADIYVADNASDDDSVSFLTHSFPEVGLIQNAVNGGFAKGYNDALKTLSHDIFVLVNSDVEVTPGWLSPIIREFESSPTTGSVQPKILDLKNKQFFEYAGAAGGFLDRLGYPYCRGRILDTVEKDQGQYDEPINVFWTSGACMAIRRTAFLEAGKFDEDYFAHQEEIDLCWRMHHAGWSAKALGDSSVYHLGGATLSTFHPKKTFYNFRNSLYSLLKNVPGKKVYFILLLRLLLDGLAGIKFLVELKPSHTAAIVQAHFNFYRNFFHFVRKRKKIMRKNKYFSLNSVVLAYYLMQKKTFEEL